jgi:hypothetical protein
MGRRALSVAAVDDFADGCEFGAAGPYVRIHGIAEGELDPAATQNDVIVDLDRAGRNACGMVDYEADFFILRPKAANLPNSPGEGDPAQAAERTIMELRRWISLLEQGKRVAHD